MLTPVYGCTDNTTPTAPVHINREETALVKPLHVILITADTMRGDVSSVDGGPVVMTNLQSLADEGWHFQNAYANSMLTTPSHVSIMTSLYPRDHGVYHNQEGVESSVPTLAQELKANGYHTAAVIGFKHLNPNVSNLGQGFSAITQALAKVRTALDTVEEGLKLLEARPADKPVFLWLHMVDPHSPYEALHDGQHREKLLTPSVAMKRAVQSAPGFQRTNPWFKRTFEAYGETRPLLEHYNDEVLEVDLGLGKLRLGLEKAGMWENTAIVFTSDHGENLGEHELYFHHGGLYEEAVKVPLVIRVPGEKAKTYGGLAQGVDIAPTVMGLVGETMWESGRGRDLGAVIRSEIPGNRFVFSEHLYGQMAALRSAEHTYILHRKSTKQFPSYPIREGHQEFYHRSVDPKESNALPLTGPVARKMRHVLTTYLRTGPIHAAKPAQNQDIESLKALGYVE